MRFPEHRQHASVGPVVAEMRGSLDVVYAKSSVLRRPVFEGRRKATCAAPPDQRIEGTTESRRWATRRQLVSQRRDDAGAIWIDEGRGEGRSASEVRNSGRGVVWLCTARRGDLGRKSGICGASGLDGGMRLDGFSAREAMWTAVTIPLRWFSFVAYLIVELPRVHTVFISHSFITSSGKHHLGFSCEPRCHTTSPTVMVMTNNPTTAEERRTPCIPLSHDH
jgi:hypothetical protein